jgi:hypothetical protein
MCIEELEEDACKKLSQSQVDMLNLHCRLWDNYKCLFGGKHFEVLQ